MQNRSRAEGLRGTMVALGKRVRREYARPADRHEHAAGPVRGKLAGGEGIRRLPGRARPGGFAQPAVECAANLLVQTGAVSEPEAGWVRAQAELDSKRPLRKWEEILRAQGADLEAYRQKLSVDINASAVADVRARRSGRLLRCDARAGEVYPGHGRGPAVEGVDHRSPGGGGLFEKARRGSEVGRDGLPRACRRCGTMGEWQARLQQAFLVSA